MFSSPPHDALLLGLLVQPARPLVLHEFVLEVVLLRHVRNEVLERRRQVVLEEPELHFRLRVLQHAEDHDSAHTKSQ